MLVNENIVIDKLDDVVCRHNHCNPTSLKQVDMTNLIYKSEDMFLAPGDKLKGEGWEISIHDTEVIRYSFFCEDCKGYTEVLYEHYEPLMSGDIGGPNYEAEDIYTVLEDETKKAIDELNSLNAEEFYQELEGNPHVKRIVKVFNFLYRNK